jgi:hypothetical protein
VDDFFVVRRSLTSGCANNFKPRKLFQPQSDGEFHMQAKHFFYLPCPRLPALVEKPLAVTDKAAMAEKHCSRL